MIKRKRMVVFYRLDYERVSQKPDGIVVDYKKWL